jgi:nicotinic acid phosphoribosyltransferase
MESPDSSFAIPISVLTDSYKAGHIFQYPEALKMVCYGEFRQPFAGNKTDNRFVFYGIRYFIETYMLRKWTNKDVIDAEKFYATHNSGFLPYPWPKELFQEIVDENDGYFPVTIEALPEGTCAHIHVPVFVITAEGRWSRLVTFLETLLTHLWYPTTVATLSRRVKDIIEEAYEQSVDKDSYWSQNSRLHDFGFRGTTCTEQSVIGGVAHLLSFTGTDTMSAAYYAQFKLNNGKPVGSSIPATEHSVMTAWQTEVGAIRRMFEKFGGDGCVFATVMDSYDYSNALDVIVPSLFKEKVDRGKSYWVLRPDSGDPVEVILQALNAAEKAAGTEINSKGFKVIPGMGAIQGDGIGYDNIKDILKAVMEAKFSVQNVCFGMGGGLLQKVNRDTMSFATKLMYIRYQDGVERNVMKKPKTDGAKSSLPGQVKVLRVNGVPTVFPKKDGEVDPNNLLKVVWKNGPVAGHVWEDFDTIKQRVQDEWNALPKMYDAVSEELNEVVKQWTEDYKANYQSRMSL